MKRNQFTFYRSFYEAVMTLPRSMRFRVVMAIVEYALDGVLPEGLSPAQSAQFILVRPVLESARKKAISGSAGGKISRRGAAEKISKIEIEVEADTEGFAAFWQRYPKKLGKAQAMSAWVCVQQQKEEIMLGLEDWCNSESWHQQNGRFVPKPEKWLRERWWEQSPKQVIPCGASGQLGQAELEAISRILEE